MKLSIITINYNNKDGLQKTINSVIIQTYKDFEWIIIDGGSTDGSKELIEKYADYITYWVSEPDKGIYNAMNKGILASHGEYLLFLNSGDYFVNSDVLKKSVSLLGEKDIYVGDVKQKDCIIRPNLSTIGDVVFTMAGHLIPHQSTFIHRNMFVQYGLYREDMYILSDWYFFNKAIILNNATVCKLPFIVSFYEGGGLSSKDDERFYPEKKAFFVEHPRIYYLQKFHWENKEIIEALKGNRFFFWIFRVYFYIYRKYLKG